VRSSTASRQNRVLLLHWKQEEIASLTGRIHGFEILPYVPGKGAGMKGLAAEPVPDVLLISLERQPSNGHAVAHVYHQRKATRHVPVVFAGGDPVKVAKIRAALPWARFCGWDTVSQVLAEAVANPIPSIAAASQSSMSAQRPLYAKLGLTEGMHVALLAAPASLHRLVPDLPFELEIGEQPERDTTLTLWFVRSVGEVDDGFAWISSRMKRPRIWVFYARGKAKSKVGDTSLTWGLLSEKAAAFGLAQFKVLRLNEIWTGVAFGQSAKRQ
jgi:hypothetical protein